MAILKGKLQMGTGAGLNLTENGVSPYCTTPLGPVDAGLTCIATPIRGVRFSIGNNPGNMFMGWAKQMAFFQDQRKARRNRH
jgi:hypothetical protein